MCQFHHALLLSKQVDVLVTQNLNALYHYSDVFDEHC